MTAERAHEPRPEKATEAIDALILSQNTLIPIQRRAHERHLTDKEREMLDSFYGFSQQRYDVDPRHNSPAQSESIALAAHEFLADTIERRIELLRQTPEAHHSSIQVFVIPKGPVVREIKRHYQEFGYNRRTKSERFQAREENLLADKKKPIYAMVYEDQNQNDADSERPRKKVPRAAYFQELALGIQLEGLLRKQGYVVAADSTEVLLAAYGAWFPRQRADAITQYGIVRVSGRDSHNVYRINEEDIPEEFRAETSRYPEKD
jgi:hypothetical protein